MMKQKILNYAGYTLLELLLVIFIISMLALLGISYYQKETLTSKITKTSLQMQQILQAATAYYVDNNCWPNSSANPKCTPCPKGIPDFALYLPSGISTNSFGSAAAYYYSYHPEPQLCQKFQVLSGELPSANIIDRLIAALPTAGRPTTTIYPNQVLAEAATPAITSAAQSGYILQYIRYVNSSLMQWTYSFAFNCPAGWQAIGIIAPVGMSTTPWTSGDYYTHCGGVAPGNYSISTLSATTHLATTFPPIQPIICQGNNPAVCHYDVTFQSRLKKNKVGCPAYYDASGTLYIVELGFCENPQLSRQNKLLPTEF